MGEYSHPSTANSQEIVELVRRYGDLGYPLSIDQIVRLTPCLLSREDVRYQLDSLVQHGILIHDRRSEWYCLRGTEDIFALRSSRTVIARDKEKKIDPFLGNLLRLKWIRLILITGSCALYNATSSDDIDLLIITSAHTMFLCRLYAHILSIIYGVRRRPLTILHPDSVCINVWLDGSNTVIPKVKRSLYSARELCNARVLVDRGSEYNNFLSQNAWVMEFLPNWDNHPVGHNPKSEKSPSRMVVLLNKLLGILQLLYMRRRITREIVGQSQLWLHPTIRD